MLRFFLNRGRVIEGTTRVEEVFRVEDSSAIIALVPACVWVVAVRAFSLDETVWEKAFVVETIKLGYLLAVDEAVLLNFEVKVPYEFFMNSALGSSIIVEFNLEDLQKLDDEFVVLVRKLARWYAPFDGFHLDGSAVFVAPADHDNIFALQSKVTCVNVRGQ